MHVYLDESGDLGWSLDQPYRYGGSSRYLTLVFLLVPRQLVDQSKRMVRKFRKRNSIAANVELKGKDLTDAQLMGFVADVVSLLKKHPAIRLLSITVMKERVQEHIRRDPNKLYNYMVALCLTEHIEREEEILFTPDPRSIKVASGNSMIDYLQVKLWFERGSATTIVHKSHESHNCLPLQLVDVLAYIYHRHFEDGVSDLYNVLEPLVSSKCLFFRDAKSAD